MFPDRHEAGLRLAEALADYSHADPLVLALPRGGVPVATAVARALGADLDILVVRKIGAPGNPEYAMGAVGEDDVLVIDHDVRRTLHVTEDEVRRAASREREEVERRVRLYRHGSRRIGIAGRPVIIVDDGLATGSTAAAAVRVARLMGARHITLAVPVGSRDALDRLGDMVDDIVCLEVPEPFWAVGQHYEFFDQVDDSAVLAELARLPRRPSREPRSQIDREISVEVGGVVLPGHLTVPFDAVGIVLFVHGTGSSRTSPRNAALACLLRAAGLGTLLFDLASADETRRGDLPGVEQGAERVMAAAALVQGLPEVADLPLGYLGSSSGAAVALAAAADDPSRVRAVVCRGGRPDLATDWLPRVQAPTLLIVGGRDFAVLDVNRSAERLMRCPHLLEVVRGATHLFEEEGTLAQAGALARSWFLRHLVS